MLKNWKKFWIAGFFLPAINATVFTLLKTYYQILSLMNRLDDEKNIIELNFRI